MRWIAFVCLIVVGRLAAGTESAPPQPVAWPAGPMEVRVAFPSPIDPSIVERIAAQAITFGGPSRMGGAAPPRGDEEGGSLRIAAARVVDGGRTLVLFTDPHPREASYVLTLPNVREAARPGEARDIRLEYDLSGVEATWDDGSEGAKPTWSGWWPALDVEAVRALSIVSADHEKALPLLSRSGRLTVRTLASLPAGKATVSLEAGGPIVEATAGGEAAEGTGKPRIDLALETSGEEIELSATVRTGPSDPPPALKARYRTAADPTDRPLAPPRLTVPWAPPTPKPAGPPSPPFDLAGGDRAKGEAVFFGEEAKCSACHRVRGRGGEVGPDLGGQAGRDRALVYRDIAEPSAAIRPDFLPYTVALRDGRVVVGIVRAEGADALRVVDPDARATVIPRSEVEELRPGITSIMPVGLVGALGEARLRDLIAFLTAPAGAEAK